MNIDDELYKLMIQNNPQVNQLRLRAISGNNKMMDQFIKIIKKLLKDQNNHHIAYKQVNEFLISARPQVVDQINQRVIIDIINAHCRPDLDQYIILWKSIMNGTNNNYPNFQQKLKNIKLATSDKRQLTAPFIKSKNQFIKNSKSLQQRVQFFQDSYRNSHDTRKTNSIEDFIDSFSSHSQSSIAIQKQMQDIDKIRIQVQRGPLDESIARKHLNKIKKFLSKKPRSLKKTLSLNFNDNRIWCQQYVDNYNHYLSGGSLHIYKHFNALVTENNYQGEQQLNKRQDPAHITIRKGIDQQVFKEDLKKRNSKRLITNNDNSNSNMIKGKPYQQQNFMRSQNIDPIVQNTQGQYYKSMPPGFYQNSDKMNLPIQSFPNQAFQNNQLNQVQEKPIQNNMYKSFNSQAFTYVPPPDQTINQQNPNARTQQYSSQNNQLIPPQNRVYSTVQSFAMNNAQPQQKTHDQINIGNQNVINRNNEIKNYSRGLKGVKNPQFYQTQALQFNRSQAQTYHNPKNLENINPAYYHSQALPYNYNQLNPYTIAGQQLNKQPGDPVFILDGKTTPIKSLAPLAGSKSSDNLFFASSRSRERPKIFGNSARRSRIQQPDEQELTIKKYGERGQQHINKPQSQYYAQNTQNIQNIQNQANNNIPYNRTSYETFITDYNSPKNSLKIQDNKPHINQINYFERGQNPYQNQVSKPFTPYRSDPGYYSPQKNTLHNYPIENNTSRLIKLSQFQYQKKKRKQGIANQPFQPIEQYVLMPYIKHFNEMSIFNRFRRNCLQNKFILYVSPELLVNCTTEMMTDSKIKVQLTYKNQTDSNLYLQTLYRIPSCLKVQKKAKINKTSLIDQQITHTFFLDLVSFPLQPCLLNLKYARQQRYESFKTSYPVIISMPITLRNFLPYIVLNEYEWKQKWDQWIHNNNYLIMRNFPMDTTMIQQQQLGQGLKQYTKLTAIPGQSVRQYGAYCNHYNFNNLNFLFRISQRVDNIITLYILANKRFLNQDQNDYLQYCLSIWAMLLAKIQPHQVQ